MLAATLSELTDSGYAELTVDNVARRAGVHKTTLYRRWKDRESLVVDALIEHIAEEMPMPDTGTIEGDLQTFARMLVAWLTSPAGEAIFSTLVMGCRVPEIAELKRQFFEDRLQRNEPMIARAIARGELPRETDAAEVIKTLIAPIYLRLLVTAETIDESIADQAAGVALAAARGGALSTRHTSHLHA